MTLLECRALRSDDTLGFLAALGLLELCTSSLGPGVALGWSGVGGAALLQVPLPGTGELARHLEEIARTMRAQQRVLHCADPGPVRKPDSVAERRARREAGQAVKLDPASLSLPDAVGAYRHLRTVELQEGDSESARWLAALVNQLATARSGLCALTPLYSPSGQMTLHQLYRDHLTEILRAPETLQEALDGWRRRPGTGANLDTRALRDAVRSSRGLAENAAVPGASWLALMAVPFFRQSAAGRRRPEAAGWEAAKGGPHLRWPIWTTPLDRPAVEVLLSHPALAEGWGASGREGLTGASRLRRSSALRTLGVEAICVSRRRPLGKSAGALRPPRVEPVP